MESLCHFVADRLYVERDRSPASPAVSASRKIFQTVFHAGSGLFLSLISPKVKLSRNTYMRALPGGTIGLPVHSMS